MNREIAAAVPAIPIPPMTSVAYCHPVVRVETTIRAANAVAGIRNNRNDLSAGAQQNCPNHVERWTGYETSNLGRRRMAVRMQGYNGLLADLLRDAGRELFRDPRPHGVFRANLSRSADTAFYFTMNRGGNWYWCYAAN